MTPENFTAWLRGFIELKGETPTPEQWQIIMDHLKEVFVKVTPLRQPSVEKPSWPNGSYMDDFGSFSISPVNISC